MIRAAGDRERDGIAIGIRRRERHHAGGVLDHTRSGRGREDWCDVRHHRRDELERADIDRCVDDAIEAGAALIEGQTGGSAVVARVNRRAAGDQGDRWGGTAVVGQNIRAKDRGKTSRNIGDSRRASQGGVTNQRLDGVDVPLLGIHPRWVVRESLLLCSRR